MEIRPIDANAMLNELRPLGLEAEHSAMLLSDVSKMMREWVDRQPTLTPPNDPLTIEELRQMDGEPVYVVPVNEFSELGKWCVLSVDDSDDYSCALVPGIDCWAWRFEAYGETWFAYRRPPEGEEE